MSDNSERSSTLAQRFRKIARRVVDVYADADNGNVGCPGSCAHFHEHASDFAVTDVNVIRQFDARLDPTVSLDGPCNLLCRPFAQPPRFLDVNVRPEQNREPKSLA